MSSIIAYIVRLVGYALLVGAPARAAEYFWNQKGLDRVNDLQAPHDSATLVLLIAPFVLAVFGYGRLRPAAVFVALYLAGAALTAPFAFARLAPA